MKKIVLTENHSRGFLSNYTTILISFRHLCERLHHDPKNIFVSPTMFSLYGNPKNWFESSRVVDTHQDVELYDTLTYFDFSHWPTDEELNLFSHKENFPYNKRVEKYIETNLLDIKNCLGIHYRGTDHYHTNRIPIEIYYEYLSKNIHKYEQVFICTDEMQIIEKFVDYLNTELKFDRVLFNNTIKSNTELPLHHNNYYDAEIKILLGDQVLLDAHSLSKCDKLICKTSNVINYARILNLNLKIHYLDINSSFRNNR